MSGHQYQAGIRWQRAGALFTDNRYSRGHSWHFDGGVVVPASSSPFTVRVPLSVAAAVDPEEALVAALASCHMLWFLSLAAAARCRVDDYSDDATGSMGRNAAGRIAMLSVTLRPRFNPNATGPEPEPRPGELPSQVDVRQMSLLGATTAASIRTF